MKVPAFIKKYDTFLLSLVVVILINVVGTTLFFRLDLTHGRVYSLSGESRHAVAALSEPLTIKVFFTSNLPAPYNTVERYLHDLLAEYAVAGNRYFNYEFYNVSSADDPKLKTNHELAVSYGISPVQVQVVEQDQVKFQNALMGMVLIHGDMIETIPAITTTEGLEYKITSSIRKMANKVSAFNSLTDKVQVRAYLSSSLQAIGPIINVQGLTDLPEKLEQIVSKLNSRYYGKLTYVPLDPSKERSLEQEAVKQNILSLRWNDFRDPQGRIIHADTGFAGIVVQHKDRSVSIQMLRVQQIPLFGTQYSLASLDDIEKTLAKTVESVVNVNEEIGYLADHGTPPLYGSHLSQTSTQAQEGLGNFNKLLSKDYSVRPVSLKDGDIPESLPQLIIVGPREPFLDYELYQIDQFLMLGKSLAIFLDAFNEVTPSNQGGFVFQNQSPYYLPVDTGLEKLLSHYGLNLTKSYVLDESCYKQKISPLFGGGERDLFVAPIIKNDKINKDVPYLSNIKGLVLLKAAPVEIIEQRIKDNALKYSRLFSSSDKSWTMAGRIDLNPMMIQPPTDPGKFKGVDLAYVVEGAFPSYFADKPIPEKPAQQEKKDQEKKNQAAKGQEKKGESNVQAEGITIKKGQPGKIFLIGTSEILKNNIVDEEGKGPNAQFVLNVIDALNNRTDNTVMRTKAQSFNPLRDVKPGVRTLVKTVNIVGLPMFVIVIGLLVWLKRTARKRAIQRLFEAEGARGRA